MRTEQNDRWAGGRHQLGLDILAKSRPVLIATDEDETDETIAAISA